MFIFLSFADYGWPTLIGDTELKKGMLSSKIEDRLPGLSLYPTLSMRNFLSSCLVITFYSDLKLSDFYEKKIISVFFL